MELTSLLKAAMEAQKQAHAPYSTKFIGASVLWSDGTITGGCNIENASYGATVCAERVAIWKGLSENRLRRIKEILVVSPSTPAWPPCGMCRQVISEFASPQTLIHWSSSDGSCSNSGKPTSTIQTKTFAEMLPEAFTSQFL